MGIGFRYKVISLNLLQTLYYNLNLFYERLLKAGSVEKIA